jgi:hypothetical protein
VAIASAVAMIVAAFGTWVRVLGLVSVSGVDAGHGWIVVVAALIGVASLFAARSGTRPRIYFLPVAILAGLGGAALSGYDLGSLRSLADDANPRAPFIPADVISAGWGIYVALIASCGLALASALLWFELDRRQVPAAREAVPR